MKGGVVYAGEDAARVWPDPSSSSEAVFRAGPSLAIPRVDDVPGEESVFFVVLEDSRVAVVFDHGKSPGYLSDRMHWFQ